MTSSLPLQPIRRSRLYEAIVRQVQDLVSEKRLQPGDRLPSERELAESLSVSRASVREALRVLDALGLLEVRPGDGAYVRTHPAAPLDPSLYALLSEQRFLLDLVEARDAVEGAIVALAVERATPEELDALGRMLDRREAALHEGQADLEADLEFHRALAETTRNSVLISLMRQLCEAWLQSRERTGREPTSPRRALAAHRSLLANLRARKRDAAEQAMRAHLSEMRDEITGSLTEPHRTTTRAGG